MPSASKNKGNRNELEIARLFSAWWGEDFKRTPNSGALRWNGASWTYGDILPPQSFPGVIEAKHYAAVDVDEVLRNKSTDHNVLGWWGEVRADAARAYAEMKSVLQPLLIYKQNRISRRIVLESDLFIALGGRQLELPVFWVTHPDYEPFAILQFSDFLENVTRDAFLSACKKVIPSDLVEQV